MTKQATQHLPLFALGFRTFFALSGLSALLLIIFWKSIYTGELTHPNYFSSTLWHAHEMLFGYSVAVISGFLLTAVQNWTGKPTITGDKLAGLALLWLYGRFVPFYSDELPHFLIAAIDFAFLPLLAYYLSKPIVAANHKRSLIFIGLLALMAFGNGLIHAEQLGFTGNTAWQGIQLVIMIVTVMILVIAGRVFPFFTERGLPGTLPLRNPLLDGLSIGSAVLVFMLIIFGISGGLLAVAAAAATIVNIARVSGWYVRQVWYVPLLWVLYSGYGWIITGFILTAFAAMDMISNSASIHAFTVGGIGVITLGMMARVSLGHTGRALRASNAMGLAFVFINLAALFRVIMPVVFPSWYAEILMLSIGAWLIAFSLFVFIYAPILVKPRVDGKQG